MTRNTGHVANIVPIVNGGYLVQCPEGCNLGTSARCDTYEEAERRVDIHEVASRPLRPVKLVQSRRNSASRDWSDAPEIDPTDVDRRNAEYGWRKYRVH